MRNYSVISGKSAILKSLAIIPFLFLFTNFIMAQDYSYCNNHCLYVDSNNCALGVGALGTSFHPAGGSYNVAIGGNALYINSGSYNTATGYNALFYNKTGSYNTANGALALHFNNDGSYNTATGFQALYTNSGSYNTANGYGALYSNTIGNSNVANGSKALFNNTAGSFNTGNGQAALFSNTTGSNNVAIGDSAGHYNNGSGNIFIGHRAGATDKYIGPMAGASETIVSNNVNNKLFIGNDAAKTLLYGDFSSGQVLLGKPDVTGYVFNGTRTLNVIGGILTDSLRIRPVQKWPDYVFNKNYLLQPLNELEQYITDHKHLPGIPSASEVQSDGVNVAEMDAKLLEKIEELTLYVIELKKESKQQQEEIDKLKSLRK